MSRLLSDSQRVNRVKRAQRYHQCNIRKTGVIFKYDKKPIHYQIVSFRYSHSTGFPFNFLNILNLKTLQMLTKVYDVLLHERSRRFVPKIVTFANNEMIFELLLASSVIITRLGFRHGIRQTKPHSLYFVRLASPQEKNTIAILHSSAARRRYCN